MNCWNESCSNFGNYLSGCRCAKPDKGQKNGSCNRQACQVPGATWYNKATYAYYCRSCAEMLNHHKLHDGSVLCSPPADYVDPVEQFKKAIEE